MVFTCETRGSILTNNWTSNDYIGDNISLIFNNLEFGNDDKSGSRSNAMLIRVDYNYVMVSQLRIRTSSLFQTSSVACTNYNGTSKNITFSVLGMYYACIVLIYILCLFLSDFSLSISLASSSHFIKACSRPVPQDGIVIPIIQTSQRNNPITFRCKDGYRPTVKFSTLCLQNGTWTRDPNDVCSG